MRWARSSSHMSRGGRPVVSCLRRSICGSQVSATNALRCASEAKLRALRRWVTTWRKGLSTFPFVWGLLRLQAAARDFLEDLRKRSTPIDGAQPCRVAGYLRLKHRHYVRRHHREPPNISDWRNSHRPGIHMLLRLVHGAWPPAPQPASARERFQTALLDGYASWERERRGLAETTWSGRRDEARRFLTWFESHRPATDVQHV